MTRLALLTAMAALLTGLVAAREDAAKSDAKKLQGTWVLASGENNGKKFPEETLKNARLTIEGDKHTVTLAGKTYKGTQKLDPAAKPKAIDIMDTEGPFKDKTVLGIYELTGDTFRICYAAPGKDRPKDFTANAGTGYHSHVWKREK